MNTTPGSAEVQLAELFWRYEAEGVLALKAARDQHSFTDQSETTQAKWLGYARVALAFGFEAGAKPAEEGVPEARPEDIAIALCLVDGHNPDDEAPRTVMCDGDNMPVPWWMVYTEYAEALIGKFNISRRASTTGAPKP